MIKSVFIDSYGNIELYLIPANNDTIYKVKHKNQESYTELHFVSMEGFLPDDYYPLTVLEWATVSDWADHYLN